MLNSHFRLHFETGTSEYSYYLLIINWKNLNMRKRKTSHQPNLKAARAVVLGQDGVGKSGKLVIFNKWFKHRSIVQYWILSHGRNVTATILSVSGIFFRAPFRFIAIKSNRHLKFQVLQFQFLCGTLHELATNSF